MSGFSSDALYSPPVATCQEIVDCCFDYLEGSVREKDRDAFHQHLTRCPACVTFFETYRKTPELTREALDIQLPSDVRESIRHFLRTRR